MRVARWALIAMTGVTAGVTLWESFFGNEVGRVIFGAAIAIAGIFLIALWEPSSQDDGV